MDNNVIRGPWGPPPDSDDDGSSYPGGTEADDLAQPDEQGEGDGGAVVVVVNRNEIVRTFVLTPLLLVGLLAQALLWAWVWWPK